MRASQSMLWPRAPETYASVMGAYAPQQSPGLPADEDGNSRSHPEDVDTDKSGSASRAIQTTESTLVPALSTMAPAMGPPVPTLPTMGAALGPRCTPTETTIPTKPSHCIMAESLEAPTAQEAADDVCLQPEDVGTDNRGSASSAIQRAESTPVPTLPTICTPTETTISTKPSHCIMAESLEAPTAQEAADDVCLHPEDVGTDNRSSASSAIQRAESTPVPTLPTMVSVLGPRCTPTETTISTKPSHCIMAEGLEATPTQDAAGGREDVPDNKPQTEVHLVKRRHQGAKEIEGDGGEKENASPATLPYPCSLLPTPRKLLLPSPNGSQRAQTVSPGFHLSGISEVGQPVRRQTKEAGIIKALGVKGAPRRCEMQATPDDSPRAPLSVKARWMIAILTAMLTLSLQALPRHAAGTTKLDTLHDAPDSTASTASASTGTGWVQATGTGTASASTGTGWEDDLSLDGTRGTATRPSTIAAQLDATVAANTEIEVRTSALRPERRRGTRLHLRFSRFRLLPNHRAATGVMMTLASSIGTSHAAGTSSSQPFVRTKFDIGQTTSDIAFRLTRPFRRMGSHFAAACKRISSMTIGVTIGLAAAYVIASLSRVAQGVGLIFLAIPPVILMVILSLGAAHHASAATP